MEIIDLTQELNSGTPVYPGDIKPLLAQRCNLAQDGYMDFTLTTGMHAGTHIDGPMHMLKEKKFISEIDISRFIGHGVLLNVFNEQVIEWKSDYDELIPENSIVLLNTGYSDKFSSGEYFTDHPVISDNFAEKIAAKKIRLLGMDIPSPDLPPYNVHKILFNAGILLAENLTNLERLNSHREFIVAALPLKVRAESAPARIVAIIL